MKEILKRTWAEIDLDRIAFNYRQVRACTSSTAKVCTVIKADAYGHGAPDVATELESLGTDFFGVSNLEEALQLRNHGIKTPILVMGYTPAAEAETLANQNISQCVYALSYAEALSKAAVECGVNVNVHIKIDTGMSRLGFVFQDINRDVDILDELLKVCRLKGLYHEGLFTHFAVSDEGAGGTAFTIQQYGCFKEMVETLLREGIMFDIIHCANSAAVLDYPLSHMDMVRAGIISYGLYPSGDVRNRVKLLPALALKSVVSHVKTVEAGATMSYGRKYTADHQMVIATVPIGYADGYSRILSCGADVLIKGRRCPIVGNICMDQLMADISELKDVNIGDIVTLIGADGDEEITATELAEFENSINYEVVCDIGKRVPRVYLKAGEIVSVRNQIVP